MARLRWLIPLLTVASLVVAGCGGSDPASSPSAKTPAQLVDAAQKAVANQSSVGFDIKLGVTLKGRLQGAGAAAALLNGPLTLDIKGNSTTRAPEKFDATFNLGFSGGSFTGEVLTPDGKTAYIQLPSLLGSGWHKVDLQSSSASTASGGSSSSLLSGLDAKKFLKDTTVTSSGDTDTIAATLDIPALVAEVTRVAGTTGNPVGGSASKAIKNAQGSMSFDKSSHLPTAFDANLGVVVPNGQGSAADGLKGVALTIHATFDDWSKDFSVQTPAGATPLPRNLFSGGSPLSSF
ncbi:MAG TPA: hypothetical protein VFQ71_02325 [Gaiellales bacterium]|jgi:hypothetical protein|nr:hypothetical protein [Gaiellales bacterium]